MNARVLAKLQAAITGHIARGNPHLRLLGLCCLLLLSAGLAVAGITGSISGTVTDPSGAAIVGATVTVTNVDTGIAQTQQTNGQGFYSFQDLPIGKYNLSVEQKGFKVYRETGIVLDVNQSLVRDVALQVGQSAEIVEVSSSALHVDTSNTQMGEVIEGKRITDVPLVTRSFTDLLALQPGVVSEASGMSGAFKGPFISAGFPAPLVSGDENAGGQSVNGMREANNGFILNGILTQETGYGGAGAIPNLDSLAEFRILTNNFNAEYGNYSGGQINVVTKSGTNDWHGNVFEFLRNTDLDAANFFNQGQRGAYHQNQFGGTFGGPIRKDKVFFFADYQGNRKSVAQTETINDAPTAAEEGGNLSGFAPQLVGSSVISGTGPNSWANVLSQQLGYTVQPGEAYYTTSCTTTDVTQANHCVLPGAQLSPTAFSPIAKNLLKYILPANGANDTYTNTSENQTLDDNKFSGRVDANSRFGNLFGYYYFDRYNRVDPYWASNAPLYPGFSAGNNGQTHTIDLGDTKTFGATDVNEFRLGYFRLDAKFNLPVGGKGISLSSLGFDSGAGGAPGIYPANPSVEGIPETDFNNYAIGVPSRPNQLLENIYQVSDNYSKVIGKHTFEFGAQYHYDQLEENLSNVANGNFFFGTNINGGTSETGVDFVDFLLGAPSSYIQGESFPSYGRNFYFGAFAQDSWRVSPRLTFNYGLRYDVSEPWHEKFNEIQTLIPGEQSVVFPGSPTGWVFPGDPGVPSTLAPTRWDKFAPRLGLAYSFGEHDGILGMILGKPGSSSVRIGWGMFYTTNEGATDFNQIGDAPFGDYTGQFGLGGPTYAAPFQNRATGTCASTPCNFFPVPAPVKGFSASHPASGPPYDTLAEFFSAYGTIGSSPAMYPKNQVPYAENYELSLERQVSKSDLITVSYVGTQGHKLLSSESANAGSPAACQAINAAFPTPPPGTAPTCGPGGENNIYILPNGNYVLGTRAPFSGVVLPVGTSIGASPCAPGANGTACVLQPGSPNAGQTAIIPFGNDSYFITAGYSAYNSLQLNWRHTSNRSSLLLGYTYSKCLDNSSGYGEQFNPVNPRLSRGLCAFDSTNNFVSSYSYNLPFDKLGGPKRLTNGWQISGITRFATGLPVTIVDNSDLSLLGTAFGGPITLDVDTPDLIGPIVKTDPRKTGGYYFSASSFGPAPLGQIGTADRRFFHGPGINNWDMALLKDTRLTERMNLQFRAELYNVFNHAQFATPSGVISYNPVSGQANPNSMGSVTGINPVGTSPARIGQLSLKLNF